jgi:hypothetical protein
MKRFFILSLTIILITSCNTKTKPNTESVYYDDFYSVLNNLISYNLLNVSVIKSETMQVFRAINNPNNPPDPPVVFTSGAFGIIKCDSSLFISLIRSNTLSSEEAWYMYNSLDSLKAFTIDSSRVILPAITKSEFEKIFNDNDLYKGYENVKSKFGTSCYIITSIPIYNSDYSKILLFINYYCGPTWGQGYQFVLHKINGQWRMIDETCTWES